MPELPPWLILTSAWNSQFSHSSTIQKRWLAGPSPTISPFLALQLCGFSLAFQPSSVFPSNMLFQPSWANADAAQRAIARGRNDRSRIRMPILSLIRSGRGFLRTGTKTPAENHLDEQMIGAAGNADAHAKVE